MMFLISYKDRREMYHIEVAINHATYSSCKKKHGAVIAKRSSAISTGHNIQKTHPANPKQRSYHAEAEALLRAGYNRAKGGTLYSFRNGLWKLSKPCPDCMEMAKRYGIKYIIYSTENEIIKERL